MKKNRMIFWNTKKLAKEFNMPCGTIGKLLKSIGATRWSKAAHGHSSVWYWEVIE